MKMKEIKTKAGLVSRYGFLCGYMETRHGIDDTEDRLSLEECDSHTCYDIKGFIHGKHVWKQYFHADYENTGKSSLQRARHFFNRISRRYGLKK